MKIGKNQHTTPYFYLNRFINPGWVYNLGSPKPKRVQSARSTAVKEFYYSQNMNEKDYPLDSINTYIEGYTAPILQELLASEDGLTYGKKQLLSFLITNLYLRVPPTIEETGKAFLSGLEQIDYKTKKLLEKAEIKVEKDQPLIKYETGESDSFTWTADEWKKELESMREKSKAGKAMMKENMSIITDLAPVIAKMSWFIIDAPTGTFFITSDRPVYLTNRDGSRLYAGWGNNNAFGTLPLSPKRYLILSYLYPSDTWAYKQATIKEVEYLNARTVASAKYAVYSPEKYPPAENWLHKAV
ncbi:MAG: DUF4238 domain-containing protein [Deltaproteobacteria bacterium]|nr:DUF4238 domain-containing protein [Deltaproteobacteria bacterium]